MNTDGQRDRQTSITYTISSAGYKPAAELKHIERHKRRITDRLRFLHGVSLALRWMELFLARASGQVRVAVTLLTSNDDNYQSLVGPSVKFSNRYLLPTNDYAYKLRLEAGKRQRQDTAYPFSIYVMRSAS